MRVIDLTHTFEKTMPVYPGDPEPSLNVLRTVEKDECADHLIHTTMHVGTHMDGPLHMIAGGKYLSEMAPETYIGPGYLLDARGHDVISAELLKNVPKGRIILTLTGYDKKFGAAEYYDKHPVFSEEFAERAVKLGAKILGMDFPSPDRPPFAVHKILLSKEILIVENLTNLEQLNDVPEFTVAALPMKVHADAAPARVVAIVGE